MPKLPLEDQTKMLLFLSVLFTHFLLYIPKNPPNRMPIRLVIIVCNLW